MTTRGCQFAYKTASCRVYNMFRLHYNMTNNVLSSQVCGHHVVEPIWDEHVSCGSHGIAAAVVDLPHAR